MAGKGKQERGSDRFAAEDEILQIREAKGFKNMIIRLLRIYKKEDYLMGINSQGFFDSQIWQQINIRGAAYGGRVYRSG